MLNFKIGDIVARNSYGGDVHFVISDIIKRNDGKKVYVLRGLLYRIQADSTGEDLIIQNPSSVQTNTRSSIHTCKSHAAKNRFYFRPLLFRNFRSNPGTILHVDSSEEFLNICLEHYREANIKAVGFLAPESEQPYVIGNLLRKNNPNILVVTGHDSLKKNAPQDSLDSYSNSRYYLECVKEARKYQPSADKLCVFAGACQSYFESLMKAGANFASSPGRVLINALDPALVAEKVSLTDSRRIVTPQEVARITITGSKGIGGKNTRGQLIYG
ncbi:MAG: sporulation peptidase YabG [Clostridia bacterium]|nr:sporulation peptidase YabG [Clostridia bacterium]